MKTVKLPYKCKEKDMEVIQNLQRQSTSMIKIAYNRFIDGLHEKDIRALSNMYNNVEMLNSWLKQCAIKKAEGLYKKDKQSDKVTIFGGKFNFYQRLKGKINKEEFKSNTKLPICSQGEKLHKGNRMFNFKLNENIITFKISRNEHINLTLPKLRKNLRKELTKVQELVDNRDLTISVELTKDYIYLIYDESKLNTFNYKGNKNIVASIDLNPNYIGFSISHFKGNEQVILFKEVADLSHFTQNLHKASNSIESKKQVNKQKHELINLSKRLVNICKRFHVGQFIVEDLTFKHSNKGKSFNRLCKNKWNRQLVCEKIQKYCNLNNIEFKEVNACYTSFIGNLVYNEPDMIAASLEIARRGFYKFQKDKFYPDLIKVETLRNRWKKDLERTYNSWVELFNKIKIMELKYRNSLKDYSFKVFRFSSSKSFINLYSFI